MTSKPKKPTQVRKDTRRRQLHKGVVNASSAGILKAEIDSAFLTHQLPDSTAQIDCGWKPLHTVRYLMLL